jgi:hypothetical protein
MQMLGRFVNQATHSDGEAAVVLNSFRSFVLMFFTIFAIFPTVMWSIVAAFGLVSIAHLLFPFFIFIKGICRGSSDFPVLKELNNETVNTLLRLVLSLMLSWSGTFLVPLPCPLDALAFSYIIG